MFDGMRRAACRRQSFALLVALGCACAPSAAAAQEQDAPAAEPVWYGWQNLTVDGASVAMIVGGAVADPFAESSQPVSGSLFALGALGFVLGSPIVHWTHGNIGLGFGSLGVRTAAGLVGFVGFVKHGITCGDREAEGLTCDAGEEHFVLATLIGIVAIAMDSALAREPAARARTRPALRPDIVLGEREARLELRGAF